MAADLETARPKTEDGQMNSEPMDVDGDGNVEQEEEDWVVSEYDVYFNKPQSDDDTSLYVLQYPLRPCWRPYELDQRCKEVRVRPRNAEFEVDLSVDIESDNYNSSDPNAEKMKSQTLTSSWRPPRKTGYAVGIMVDRKVYLNPVRAIAQLRPSMEYLNSCGSKKRTVLESNVKAEESAKEAPGGPPRKQMMEMDTGNAEAWVPLKYHGASSDLSARYLQNMMVEGNSQLQFPMSPHDYVNSLCPRAINQMETNGPSRKSLLALPLEERLKKWLAEGPSVQRFSALRHLAPNDPEKDVLRILQQFAVLVQGLWVAKTSIRYPDAKKVEILARDYVLLLFSQSPVIKYNQLKIFGTRNVHNKFLRDMAVDREYCKDWKFKEPTDVTFRKLYPDVVEVQEKLWRDREQPILEVLFGGKNSVNMKNSGRPDASDFGISPHSNKVMLQAASGVRTAKITMSEETRELLRKILKKLFETHKVCSFQTICQGLRGMAVSMSTLSKMDAGAALKAVEAPPEELQAVISEIALNVHGLYVLKSSLEHPEVDSLRNVVVDLFVGRGANAKIKKSEVIEAAKIKLQKEPSNNEFQKVMAELCISKGGAWSLKSGDGVPK